MFKKGIILAIFASLIAGFFYFDLNQYLTLEGLKSSLGEVKQYIEANPVLSIALFFTVYILATALSLPGATILTLASGALFGLWLGLLIASFASTIGATLAFLVSRFILRDSLRNKFAEKFKKIDAGIEREGPFYLFSLRLLPVFPFFVINLLMGLTSIKVRTYYWVSQVGMLAGTAVYVNAGTQLAQIESMSDILSPGLILSFVALGIFPWIAKGIVALVKRRKVYKQWNKPKKFDRNMIVLGAGAAGLVTSYIAATVKSKVTLIEASEMGGDCLNYGCVPSKALIKSAKVAEQFRRADKYGLEAIEPNINFKRVMRRLHKVIADIAPNDSVERYTKLGVDVIKGYANLIDPWTVEIKGHDGKIQRLTARSIVIATGARPFVPNLSGLEQSDYVTSDTMWKKFVELDNVPAKIVVLGGGPIGCELAQSFARLGSDVTQVERSDGIMSKEDPDVSSYARQCIEESGVKVLTSHEALRFERDGEQKYIVVSHQNNEKRIAYDEVIIAVGRQARLEGFGLDKLGIKSSRTIETNDYLQTLYPNIYAAGDVAGPYQFTHVAAHQAWYAAVNGLFGSFKKFKVDYRVIPWTTFIDPEVARVGISEVEAKEQNIKYEVSKYEFGELDRAIAESARKGFIKVLTPPGKDKILGVVVVGEHAGDLIAEFVLAMKHGLGLEKILGTIHAYPTWAEGSKYVAGNWKRANAPEKLLTYVARFHTWRRG